MQSSVQSEKEKGLECRHFSLSSTFVFSCQPTRIETIPPCLTLATESLASVIGQASLPNEIVTKVVDTVGRSSRLKFSLAR